MRLAGLCQIIFDEIKLKSDFIRYHLTTVEQDYLLE